MPISFLSRSDVPEGDQGINEVQVGGLNTSDPRFAVYKNYKGCLSSKCVSLHLVIFVCKCLKVVYPFMHSLHCA
jgi:hypothetical protein